ncbi:DUF4919 domain-containing protein [Sphingobacterium sp.]|uniref:DUF4919 domain-containing protein n=1 Tax=Sphingobacterium sp. TaxID=341027 RepID=UPI002FD96D01
MKIKTLNLMLILMFLNTLLYAQKNQISYEFEERIKTEIENPSSQYFYPNLLNKITTEPEKISSEEIKFLYYGQIYKKGSGLAFLDNPNEDSFRKAVIKNNCSKILKLGYSNLAKNPVELSTLIPVCGCQQKKGTTDNNYLGARLKMVLETIFETGDGKTKETAIKIANVEDDLWVNGILGFKGDKESFEASNGRIFSVWENGKEKIYFEDSWNYKYN